MVKNATFISFLIAFALGLVGIILFPYYTINPGDIIEDHMHLKNDCLSCHTIGAGAQTEKCIECHQVAMIGLRKVNGEERKQFNTRSSLLHLSIISMQCYDCHTEHKGLSRENATLKFRHNILSANLLQECAKCHSSQKPNDDIHTAINVNCSECHNKDAWKPSHFNHELLGDRINNCRNCHENHQPSDVLHRNLGTAIQCMQCHTTEKWIPSTFDHTKYFRFDRNHPSNCGNCHDVNKSFAVYTCYSCHEHTPAKIEREHIKEGIMIFSNCVECHRSGNKNEAEDRIDKKRRKNDDDD